MCPRPCRSEPRCPPSGVQFLITPVGNVASLVMADRSKLWPKLNYLVLGVWLLGAAAFLALPWMLSHFTG